MRMMIGGVTYLMALLKKMVILTAGENGDLDDEEDKNNEQEDH
jgi:hypothetical protein